MVRHVGHGGGLNVAFESSTSFTLPGKLKFQSPPFNLINFLFILQN